MIAPLPMSGESTIEIGHHKTAEWFGFTVHIDTIISTIVAGSLVLLLGLAIFRLIALVMTGIPLLKELKKP